MPGDARDGSFGAAFTLSILYLRCTYLARTGPPNRPASPFNSLFEMRRCSVRYEAGTPGWSFNSLFEMLVHGLPIRTQVPLLSILYLRCATSYAVRLGTRSIASFQFSI